MTAKTPNVLEGKWLSYLPPKMAHRAREELHDRERMIASAQSLLDRQTRLREALDKLEKYRRLEKITEGLPRTTLLAGLLEFGGSLPGSAQLDASSIRHLNRAGGLTAVIDALESCVHGALKLRAMTHDHKGDVIEAQDRLRAENKRWFEYIQKYRLTRRAKIRAFWRKSKARAIGVKRLLIRRKPGAH